MRWPVEVNWDVLYRDRAMCRWLIYASRYRGSKGTVVGEAPITDQSATVYLDQGVWWLRVIGGYAGCREEPWEQCRSLHHVKVIGGRQNTPPDLVNARAMPVDPNVGVRVVADPPGPGDVAHRIQVIEGPSGARGKLLQELPAWPEGALFDGARTPTPVLPIEGAGDAAGRTVVLRTISDGGIPGADQVLSLLVPERYPHVPVSLASVVGNVLNNFSTPSTPGPLDLDATYGVRLRRMPAVSDMSTWTKWGTVGAGVLAGMKFAPCAQLGYLQTPEIDLGADAVFVLECWDNLARQDAAGAWADYPVGAMSWFGMYPEDDLARDLESRYPSVGPHWLMREIHTDGTPRQPNLLSRWEYDVSTSTIETPDWKPYVPGQYIRGQYLMVRLVFREPLGWHQLRLTKAQVTAHYPRRFAYGTAQVIGGAAVIPIPNDTITGAPLFRFSANLQLTPWAMDVLPYIVAKNLAAGNFQIGATNTMLAPADGFVDWLAVGY